MTTQGLVIFLVIGAVAGWLAGQIMTDVRISGGGFGVVGSVIVGIIGSIIGGWLFGVLASPWVAGSARSSRRLSVRLS
jgi:uncharacterized membrane protein YeaQ/YmgE (transglycosylase-associated protein family)